MPLASDPPKTPAPAPEFPKNITPRIASPEYRTSVVDTKYTPIASLLTHIEGASWVVDYYSQAIGADEELTAYQPGQLDVYQSYYLIKNMELKVQSSLSSTQDEDSNSFIVNGSAVVYPFIIPNNGDTFLADVGDGRTARFTVDRVTRKTILRQTCYEIEYSLTQYLDETLHQQMLDRVVKTGYFQKDFMTYGQNPVISEDSVENRKRIEQYRKTLLASYVQWFFSVEFRTFLVPGQGVATYDPWVTNAILRIFESHEHPYLKKLRELNVDKKSRIATMNFWNVILSLNEGLVDVYSQKMGIIPAFEFSRWPMFESIYFSGIPQVVYPVPEDVGVDADYPNDTGDCTCCSGGGANGLLPLDDMDTSLLSIYPYHYLDGLTDTDGVGGGLEPNNPPLVHPVTIDDYYVLSEKFYTKAPLGQSRLELLTGTMLRNHPVNCASLFEVIDSVHTWGRLEKFYYIPLLVILLNAALRDLD